MEPLLLGDLSLDCAYWIPILDLPWFSIEDIIF